VAARTEVTIKMANAAGQSAETVSDQLTAVWNNFYDGSKSLEYYADVMTALGAATASSTEEIATGLEKFAAVAETVGLSYEYATAALATVTAETRQSADVVGTAFKTLFARLQDLELGETLDDGTTLGKYSQALYAVGIDIKDTNGELKSMDTILNELGTRWDDLAKDQQVALAQTVAGTRQYTQLVALMDNWGTFQKNLTTAQTSTGSLDEQAAIYAEGWEAARDRVTAAAQGIWDDLISDEFFIDLLNIIEKIVTGIDWFIDSLGGLEGTLAAIGALLTKVFADKIAQGISTMALNLQTMTKSGRAKLAQEQTDFLDSAKQSIPASPDFTTDVEKAQ
jgi:TP901 family phage tail tape measure protein